MGLSPWEGSGGTSSRHGGLCFSSPQTQGFSQCRAVPVLLPCCGTVGTPGPAPSLLCSPAGRAGTAACSTEPSAATQLLERAQDVAIKCLLINNVKSGLHLQSSFIQAGPQNICHRAPLLLTRGAPAGPWDPCSAPLPHHPSRVWALHPPCLSTPMPPGSPESPVSHPHLLHGAQAAAALSPALQRWPQVPHSGPDLSVPVTYSPHPTGVWLCPLCSVWHLRSSTSDTKFLL